MALAAFPGVSGPASFSTSEPLRLMTVAALPPWREPQILDDLVRMCQLSGTTEVTLLFQGLPQQAPLLEKAHRFIEQFDRARKRLAAEGIGSAILMQSLVGHADTGMPRSPAPFQRITGWDGTECAACFCPADPDFIAYVRDLTSLLASARPTLLMVDDDVRLNNHAPATWSCACPHHLRALADLTGQTYTREALFQGMAGRSREALQLRKQWLAAGGQTLVNLAQAIRHAIDTVDPTIRCGQCISNSYHMLKIEPVVRALAGTTRPLARLAGAMYMEAGYKDFGATMTRMALQRSTLSEAIECVCEADTCPHTFYSMSRRTLRGFIAGSLLASRVDGAYPWIPATREWIPAEWTGYARTLGENGPYFESLARLVRRVRWQGPSLICREVDWQPPSEGRSELAMPIAWASTLLGRMGLPFTVNDPAASVAMLSGCATEALDDAALKDLLSRGVLLDGQAAWHLCQRGFSRWLGVDIRPLDTSPGCDREILQEHALNGVSGGLHLRSACPDARSLMRLDALDSQAIELSYFASNRWFHDPHFTHAGTASMVYRNELGGRVAIFAQVLGGTDGFDSQTQAFLNAIRKEQLVNLLGWLAGEPLPVVATAPGDTYVLAGTDQVDGAQVVAVFNLNPDEETSVDLRLGDDSPRRVWALDAAGQWQETPYRQAPDRMIQIQHPLATMMPVVLKLQRA